MKKIKRGQCLLAVLSLMIMIACDSSAVVVRANVKAKLDKDRNTEREVKNPNADEPEEVVTKIETQVYELDVKLTNIGTEEATLELEWYFLSCGVDKNTETKPCEKGSKQIKLAGNQTAEEQIVSKPLVKKDLRRGNISQDANKVNSVSGYRYRGYVVLVKHEGKIVAEKSNSSTYLKDEWLARLATELSQPEKSDKKDKKDKKDKNKSSK